MPGRWCLRSRGRSTVFRYSAISRRASERSTCSRICAIWDTTHNNGMLIYLLLADHDVEIVADRGIHAKVGASAWKNICAAMETEFRQGRFEAGRRHGHRSGLAQLAKYFPKQRHESKRTAGCAGGDLSG